MIQKHNDNQRIRAVQELWCSTVEVAATWNVNAHHRYWRYSNAWYEVMRSIATKMQQRVAWTRSMLLKKRNLTQGSKHMQVQQQYAATWIRKMQLRQNLDDELNINVHINLLRKRILQCRNYGSVQSLQSLWYDSMWSDDSMWSENDMRRNQYVHIRTHKNSILCINYY